MTRVTCGEARRLGWGRAGRPVTSLDRGLFLAHTAQCESCRRFAEDMLLVERQVQRAALELAAPTGIAARLLRRVAAESSIVESPTDVEHRGAVASPRAIVADEARRSFAWLRRGLLGTALAAAAALAVMWTAPAGPEAPAHRLARMRDELLLAPGIESSDVHVVASWVHARLGLTMHVPSFADARLAGAAVVRLDGDDVAVLRYQVGAQYLAYAVLPRQRSAADTATAPTELRDATHRGLHLVSWSDDAAHHVWIGALPAPALRSFATRCIAQAAATRQRAALHAPWRSFARSDG